MVKCAVCKENEAQQTHHITYVPEMTIEVCKFCHFEIHSHGVGIGRQAKQILFPKGIITSKFTKTIMKDKTPFVVNMNDAVLTRLVCPNSCSHWEWGIWGSNDGVMYARCSECGYDVKFEKVKIVA